MSAGMNERDRREVVGRGRLGIGLALAPRADRNRSGIRLRSGAFLRILGTRDQSMAVGSPTTADSSRLLAHIDPEPTPFIVARVGRRLAEAKQQTLCDLRVPTTTTSDYEPARGSMSGYAGLGFKRFSANGLG